MRVKNAKVESSLNTKSECIKVSVRDLRPSIKEQLGRFLLGVDWSILSTESADNQAALFDGRIQLGVNNIMPDRTRIIHRTMFHG